jgi:polyisoprenyl-phosphate glycosyltransferase
MTQKAHISVVTPVYGCAQSLPELHKRLVATLSAISSQFEIIMVNDASPDQAWDAIQELAVQDSRVKGINLSRNFGQHHAITAGLDFAHGDWVVVMDCDLQDKPEEIKTLYTKAQEGFDIVVGKRENRQDSFFKKLGSRAFYHAFNYFSDTSVNNTIGNFGVYSQHVIKNIRSLREQDTSFGLSATWVGFTRAEIKIEHNKRKHGQSSYTIAKLISLATGSITSHSNKLLHLSVKAGLTLSIGAIIASLWLIVKYFFLSKAVLGWTSTIVSLYFLAGLILFSIGITGLYIGKIFDNVKNRPLYIIKETTFSDIAS